MNPSIPAARLSSVIPGVVSAGGNPLALNSVFLTTDPSILLGTVQAFPDAASVSAWFGAQAPETLLANIYFAGTDISDQIPATLYFAQYNTSAVAGYVRGASLKGLSLTGLQALTGTVTLSLDGVPTVSAAINLAGATSFSNAAALIQTGLRAGTPTNTAVVTFDALRFAFIVESATTGASSSVTVAATSALSTGLALTAATGAQVSPGAIAAVPAALMTGITGQQQNWAVFMTVLEVQLSVKEAFAAWVQTTTLRYVYACQDSDITPTESDNASGSFGAIVAAANMDGIEVIYDNGLNNTVAGAMAAFFCAYVASLNFAEAQGNTTAAFRGQAGLTPQVTDETTYNNLLDNGYNCYASFATSTAQFQEYQPGSMSGKFLWANAYVNQIWLNSGLQQANMQTLKNFKSIPYNTRGQNIVRSGLLAPIKAALNFGAIQPGIQLSDQQIVAINNAAGVDAATTISQVGWYLQILQPAPSARTTRSSFPMKFWYSDGGSVQSLNLASIDVQ